MTALAIGTDSIDGLRESEQERAGWRSLAWMTVVVLIVIASIVSSLSYTARADGEVDRQLKATLSLYHSQAVRSSQVEQLKNQEIGIAAQATIDASLVDAVPQSRLLAEISNALPAGLRLAEVSLNSESPGSGPEAAPVSPGARTDVPANIVSIRGVALNDDQVAQFVKGLSNPATLKGVELLSRPGNRASEKGPREFELAAILVRLADVQQVAGR
jgi:hypothetical protein